MFYTLLTLCDGVLSVDVEGVIEEEAWRKLVAPGLRWLKAQGGGSLLIPHALS